MSTSQTTSNKSMKDTEKTKLENEGHPFSLLMGELLFTLLPFAVLFIIYLYKQKDADSYLLAPEWAFASAILFGQTIVKFVQGMIEASPNFNPIAERIGFAIAILIVIGLVPALIILTLILLSPAPPLWLGYTQIVMFLLAVAAFLSLGAIAHSEAVKSRKQLIEQAPKP